MNNNIKNILEYLIKIFPNQTWDELEQDIKDKMVTLDNELFNMFKALTYYKDLNKNNQRVVTSVNQYIKMLLQENKKVMAR